MRDLAERLRDWSLAGCEHNIPMDDGRACWPCIRDRLTASTVVLDPDDAGDIGALTRAMVDAVGHSLTFAVAENVLRSLLPSPEPNGRGAVVLRWSDGVLLRRRGGGWQIIDKELGSDTAWTNYMWSASDVVISHGHGCSCGAPDCPGGDQ